MQNENLSPSSQHEDVSSAQVVNLRELQGSNAGNGLLDGNLSLIAGVKVRVEVLVGSAEISVEELFKLGIGSVLPLEQMQNAPLAIRLDGKTIALGSLVVVGDNFGIRISEITQPESTGIA